MFGKQSFLAVSCIVQSAKASGTKFAKKPRSNQYKGHV